MRAAAASLVRRSGRGPGSSGPPVSPAATATAGGGSAGPAPSRQRGVIFIWVLVSLFVLAVFLVAAVQPASIIARRQKEKELIFRGEAYTEAIRQFQAEHGGAFPTQLKQLVERGPKQMRYIRRLYRNPFAPDGKWVLLTPGTTTVKIGEDGKPIYTSGPAPGQGAQGAMGTAVQPGRPPTVTPGGMGATGTPGAGGTISAVLPFRIGGQDGQPIMGVLCKEHQKAFESYRNADYYDQWYFSPLVIPPPSAIQGGRVTMPTGTAGQGAPKRVPSPGGE